MIMQKSIADVTALGLVVLTNDVGGVVAFLCTEDAKWITRQRIEVSGGMNLYAKHFIPTDSRQRRSIN